MASNGKSAVIRRSNWISSTYQFLWEPEEWDEARWERSRKHIANEQGRVPRFQRGDVVRARVDPGDDFLTVCRVEDSSSDAKGRVGVSFPMRDSHAIVCTPRERGLYTEDELTRVARLGLAQAFEYIIFLLIGVNILTFILGTLDGFGTGTSWDSGFDALEDISVGIFTVEYIVRLVVCVEHADKSGKRVYRGVTGRLRYAATDFYAVLDLAAILPFYVDLALTDIDIIPTTWFRTLRLLRLLKADREMDMFSRFDDAVREIWPALVATGYAGLVVWVIFATLMYYCERNNDDVGGRMNSIPNAMYYTMQMLMGEFVLNNEFTPAGKVVATCIALFGTIFFSIPVGLFGSAFLSIAEGGDDDEDEDESEGEDNDADVKEEGLDAKVEAGDSRKGDDSKEDSDGAETRRTERSAANAARAWALVSDAGSALTRSRAAMCYFLSAYGFLGVMYERFTFVLILLAIVNTILDSVPSVRANPGWDSFSAATEYLSIAVFTCDYLARLWCCVDSFDEVSGKREYVGWRGRIVYMCSFFGLVDLLSFLPFFIVFALTGQTDSNSSQFVRAFRLIRILKVEKFSAAFTLFDDVWVRTRPLLIGLGYTIFVLWILFSSIMYLIEKNHSATAPDDDIVDHPYGNMLESMWYTLLNLTGEFPLGDYSVPGKIVGFFMVLFAIELYGSASGVFADGFQNAVEEGGLRKDVW